MSRVIDLSGSVDEEASREELVALTSTAPNKRVGAEAAPSSVLPPKRRRTEATTASLLRKLPASVLGLLEQSKRIDREARSSVNARNKIRLGYSKRARQRGTGLTAARGPVLMRSRTRTYIC